MHVFGRSAVHYGLCKHWGRFDGQAEDCCVLVPGKWWNGGSGGTNGGGANWPGGSQDTNQWWQYGTGWPWSTPVSIPMGDDPYGPWWTGNGGSGGAGVSTTVEGLTNQLSLSYAQTMWLEANQLRALEIDKMLNVTSFSDLNYSDKVTIAQAHLSEMMNNPEYLEMVEGFREANMTIHPWMLELFKELGIEIGLKILKKYLPGYGDWQSIKDAIDNGSHGDWIGVFAEVLNIVKKKVPALAVIDATIDAFINTKLANSAWKTFEKLKDLPTNAFNGLLKTIKEKCGGILG